MSCPRVQAASELCAGCFAAKLPGETGNNKSTLSAAASGFSFLDLGKHKKVEREGIISQRCLQRV